MMPRSALTTLLTTALLLGACGDDKDWDQEIILQLFKPAGKSIGNVKIEATQSKQTRSVTVGDDIFGACDTNSVRIIPKDSTKVAIKLTWSSGSHGFDVNLPAKNPVKVVLGAGASGLAPSGCAPAVIPDGGPQPDQATFPTGFMCSKSGQCTGGLCISSYMILGTSYSMPKGYCSRDCSVDPCPSYEHCFENKDGNGQIKSKVCLKKCQNSSECRESDGYHCTPAGNVCLPK